MIGSGINGMVAAAELALAGWSVALVERNRDLGGFIATEERTLPGYLHDTYSSWHPLFLAGPAFARLRQPLAEHGLRYHNTEGWLCASVADDGRVTVAHRDPAVTADGFAVSADRTAYLASLRRLGDNIGPIAGLMGSELRSPTLLRHVARLLRIGGRAGVERQNATRSHNNGKPKLQLGRQPSCPRTTGRASDPTTPARDALEGVWVERSSPTVGRSAAGRRLNPDAATRAVNASVRHEDTTYDELLMAGLPREQARERIRNDIDRVLERWRRPA
ncbi:hypothetical protein GCM10027610_101560 [Dactylosporangium cerinum]